MKLTRRVRGLTERLKLLVNEFGYSLATRHILTRLLGTTRFLRPSSLLDFRHSRVVITKDSQSFLEKLLPEIDSEQIQKALEEGQACLTEDSDLTELSFPKNWNSGMNLKLIVFSLTRLLRPSFVMETGTANGASANAWAAALRMNNHGSLTSVDVTSSKAPLLKPENRSFVDLEISDGTTKSLGMILNSKSYLVKDKPAIFLHDSDHSYFGQYGEYLVADESDFEILLSDDVDSSLAFLDFTASRSVGVVMIDGQKMIGGVRLRRG